MIFFLLLFNFGYSQALELKSLNFYNCLKKTATQIESRNIRIHQFPKENKCAVFYSVKGRDKIISRGKWLRFCEKKADQVISNLKKGLWDCKKQSGVQVFYPTPKKPAGFIL